MTIRSWKSQYIYVWFLINIGALYLVDPIQLLVSGKLDRGTTFRCAGEIVAFYVESCVAANGLKRSAYSRRVIGSNPDVDFFQFYFFH
jgi:hypothetical protein